MKINEEVAEIIGLILGDGHLHRKSNLITIVGSLEDFYYYNKRVIPIFYRIFNKYPKLKKKKRPKCLLFNALF